MPYHRKPPVHPAGRSDGPPLPDELNFSIETTTMRLKSLKLRRAEAADAALDDRRRGRPGGDEPRPSGDSQREPAGRVRHDERGMAVWDWAAASGEMAALSASSVMRKLDVSALSIEQTQRLKAMQPARDPGGGSDPYNQHRSKGRDPFKQAAPANDPYNSVNPGAQARRPSPKPTAPANKPAVSVLDQLTGKKK